MFKYSKKTLMKITMTDDLIDDGDIEVLERFKKELLRQICHPLFSIYATTTGFIEPVGERKKKVK